MADSSENGFWNSALIDQDYIRRQLHLDFLDLPTFIDFYDRTPVGERISTSPFFDPAFYVARYDDVCSGETDPVQHFFQHGFNERRSPHALIDLAWLTDASVELGEPTASIGTLIDLLERDTAPSPYFDLQYYIDQLEVSFLANESGYFRRYLVNDLVRGLAPNQFFDPRWYASQYRDAPFDGAGAIRNFVLEGDPQGRSPGPLFDSRAYQETYPDVTSGLNAPFYHYMRFGRSEGRVAIARARARGAEDARQANPPEKIDSRAAYHRVRAGIGDRLAQMIAAVPEKAISPIVSTDIAALIGELSFPWVAPRVSILIPVYNELDYTLQALASLAALPDVTPFEVIIADDASTDPAVQQLESVPNLIYRRQPANVGFLRNCNQALSACNAPLILLLNSDTQLLPGAVDALVRVLDGEPDIGAVGPKIVYPNNRLQEAGCSLSPDGRPVMTGIFLDPDQPSFSYDRDVHYCSGAALLVRRECLGDQIFDEQFMPAYYEDTDLCLRIKEQGYRVRYCADASVMHHLSISTTRESDSKKLQRVYLNQQKFVERWSNVLIRENKIRVISFYLPQFHPTRQNDLWWGRGFTEWTNVVGAKPSYDGHYQPHLPADLGFYDLRLPKAAADQAALAARYGLEGFCVYYYRFQSGRVLDLGLDAVFADKSVNFPFCLCWANENWTKHWDGGSAEVLLQQDYSDQSLRLVCEDFVRYAQDPRYITVDGAPVFLLYRPLLLPDPGGFARMLRKACVDAGLRNPHLVYVESMEMAQMGVRPDEIGFDASVEFPPQGRAIPASDRTRSVKDGWDGHRYDYEKTAINFTHRLDASYARYPAVFPSWDNTPRQSLRGTSFDGSSPGGFQAYVEAKIDELNAFHTGDRRFLFVNAWNEWAEGAHLEPDVHHGHAWLEAMNRAMRAKGAL